MIFFILIFCIVSTDAYTISRNRVLIQGEGEHIPLSVTLDAASIRYLNNIKCYRGSAIYQAGCNDGIDTILSAIGIRENKFKRGASVSILNPPINDTVSFKLNGSFILLNTSLYKIEYWNNKSNMWKMLNFTHPGNISMGGNIKLWVK